MTATLNPNLRAYIKATLEYFAAPSASIAVVKGDETVLETFETVSTESGTQISNQTLFPAGDCGQAYVAAAAALLVDRGLLGWDDRVHVHLPEFGLPDPWISKNITLRDLLGQRIALEARDPNNESKELELNALGGIEGKVRITGFRERYAPLPLAYTAMTEIIARTSAQPFAEFLLQNLITPLGLERTIITDGHPDGLDLAQPHITDGDRVVSLDTETLSSGHRHTRIYTSNDDNTVWLRLHLKRGFVDRVPVIKWPSMNEILTPQIVADSDERRGEQMASYCLGWRLASYGGARILYHEGNGHGASAFNLLLPRENLGIAVRLGLDCPAATRAITYRLLDAFLGRSAVDWAPKFKTWAEEDRAAAAQ